jgi:hypothetical protein
MIGCGEGLSLVLCLGLRAFIKGRGQCGSSFISAEPAHTMRATTILVLLAALCVASTLATTHDPLTGVFAKWMRDNSKSYSNEEFVFRWNVWRENQQLIEEHNRSNKTFFLAMNKFGDLTNAEFNKLFKGLAFDYSLHANKAAAEKAVPAPGLPADFDWRQKGAVTHVKNQGTPLPFFPSIFHLLHWI